MSKPPYLGLDIGFARTGVALSENGLLAQPLTTVEWTPPHTTNLIKEVAALALKHEVATIVAGLPLNEDGSTTAQALKTEQLLEQLRQGLREAGIQATVIVVNEFASTQEGRGAYPTADRDSAAAALLLQHHLDEVGTSW
jgi:RNase H-fold protein (predicted Holliday junction resolvase)